MAEQKYQAVLAVIGEGRTIAEVATQWRVNRRTVHRWLARYEAGGLEALSNGSHKPARCPHQIPGSVEALVLELRRSHGTGLRAGSCSSCCAGRRRRCPQSRRCIAAWLAPAWSSQ